VARELAVVEEAVRVELGDQVAAVPHQRRQQPLGQHRLKVDP